MAIGEMSSPSPSPGLRVLVVDDERDTVITLAALLEDDGHQVAALYRAHDVIAKVKEFDPDVVILTSPSPTEADTRLPRTCAAAAGRSGRCRLR